MKTLLARALEIFIEAPPPGSHALERDPPCHGSRPPLRRSLTDAVPAPRNLSPPAAAGRAPVAALLAVPEDLDAAAGGVAAELRSRCGSRAAVVCVCRQEVAGEEGTAEMPARRAARSWAARFAAQGFHAVAIGPLCRVVVDGAPGARAVLRAVTNRADADVPLVLAFPARDAEVDALLREVDLIVLAPPAGDTVSLTELACASLAELGPVVANVAAPARLARIRARFGLARIALPELASPKLCAPALEVLSKPPAPGPRFRGFAPPVAHVEQAGE